MSLQLPAILSPPTPCIPSPALTVSPLERSPKLPCPLWVGVRFWASLTLRKLANASGRIMFNIALFMDWQFISGCLPPRLSTTQFPSTTDSQCSVRWGLPPHGWCALSGARRDALLRDPAWHVPKNVQRQYLTCPSELVPDGTSPYLSHGSVACVILGKLEWINSKRHFYYNGGHHD